MSTISLGRGCRKVGRVFRVSGLGFISISMGRGCRRKEKGRESEATCRGRKDRCRVQPRGGSKLICKSSYKEGVGQRGGENECHEMKVKNEGHGGSEWRGGHCVFSPPLQQSGSHAQTGTMCLACSQMVLASRWP